MGGCTLIVTLSMCITFSIRRKTWLTLHCSIKQLCISAQSLLICNVFIVSLFPFSPHKFEALIPSKLFFKQAGCLVGNDKHSPSVLPFLHMTTGEKSWYVSKLQAGNITRSYYCSQNVNSFSSSLIMRNKTNTVVKLVLCASVFVPYSSTSGVVMPVWWVNALYINLPKLVRLFIWKWSLNLKCKC